MDKGEAEMNNREQDGKFALKLQSNAAVLRDKMREEARQRRMQQLREAEENASLIAQGIDPAEVFL
jgi:hypothetical protein